MDIAVTDDAGVPLTPIVTGRSLASLACLPGAISVQSHHVTSALTVLRKGNLGLLEVQHAQERCR